MRMRIGKHRATLPPDYRGKPIWWSLLAPLARLSRRLRAVVFDLPHNRFRTVAVALYYRDIIDDITANDIRRHARAIDPDARVQLFGMEEFRGPRGAIEAIDQWHRSFSDLRMQLAEVILPEGPDVLCVCRLTGGGAVSGANLAQEVTFQIKVGDGMAVAFSFSNSSSKALEAARLRE